VLLILGPHRSGTSALAGALLQLGVYFGHDLLPPRPDNQKGFFESRRIVELHDQILESLNSRWDDPRPLPENWLSLPVITNYRDKLIRVLQDDFIAHPLWAVKDPRLCRLFPLWQEALAALGVQPFAVISLRHPDEVIQSLQKRDLFSADHCWLLWFRYFQEALGYSSLLKRAFVEYDRLLLDPRATLHCLAEQLGIQWPIAMANADATLEGFLDKNLKHQERATAVRGSEADATLGKGLYAQVLTAMQNSSTYTACPDTSATMPTEATSRVYASVIGRLYEEQRVYRGEIHLLHNNTLSLEAQYLQTQKDLQQTQQDLQSLLLEQEKLDAAIASIQASRSWRVTRPLRQAGHWYRTHVKSKKLGDSAITGKEQVAASRYRLARTLWRAVPLTQRQKQMLKTRLHRRAPGLLEWVVSNKGMAFGQARHHSLISSAVAPPPPHEELVSIIVCVHNALDFTKNCLYKLVRHTQSPYELIIVDDGSAEETKTFLQDFARIWQTTLIRHESAQGYTKAANAGLASTHGAWMLLINSDTEISAEWLDRMVACGASEDRIGVVGPLSNTASWQSVPEIFSSHGDWAENSLPEDMDIPGYARLLQRYSGLVYPRLAFLNGFCFMIRKECLDEVGYLDEALFPQGYGEENDFCIRARRHGWSLAVADDVFVYHAQSKSYSHDRRHKLANQADQILRQQYGDLELISGAGQCRDSLSLAGARWRVQQGILREAQINTGRAHYEGLRLAIILPVADEGGGAHVVLQEVAALRRMGVDVRIFNLAAHAKQFQQSYPDWYAEISFCADVPRLRQQIYRRSLPFDGVITTASYSVSWLLPIPGNVPPLFYYVQDYEPFFYPAGSKDALEAAHTYQAIPQMALLTKTRWNARMLRENAQRDACLIGPSVDIDAFRPREFRSQDGLVRVCAMIRPTTPRRSPARTVEVLSALAQGNSQVELHTFGCYREELDPLLAGRYWPQERHQHHGRLSHHEVAALLPKMDIFLDCSDFQAMGLTAMEAMACGCAVVVPKEGGAEDFAEDAVNAMVVDTSNAANCLKAAQRLVTDRSLRERIAVAAAQSVLQWAPETAALRLLEAVTATTVPWINLPLRKTS
jgi:GT2 family glycosyltransferase/glycosyltransferase involved in cell wall biosynthesis